MDVVSCKAINFGMDYIESEAEILALVFTLGSLL